MVLIAATLMRCREEVIIHQQAPAGLAAVVAGD
jgi:hypothetical protein